MIENIEILGVTIREIEQFIYKIILPIGLALIVFIVIYCFCKKRKSKRLKDVKKAPKGKAHGVIFGLQGRKEVFSPTDNEGSIGIFSATGTGKTSAIGIPTLRSWGGTSFTIDISGDIYKNCPNTPHKLVYEPENPDTEPFNIFGPIDDLEDVEDRHEALAQLAFLIVPNQPNANENAKYFNDNGRKILIASLIAFYDAGKDFIEICEKIVSSSYKDLFRAIDYTNNKSAMTYINSFQGVSEQNISGCKQSCDDAITLFATNSKVKKSVRRPKEGENAIEGKKIEKNNIFIIVDDPKLELYSPLLNIITSQQMQYISNRKVTETSKSILLVLDEFASLKIDAETILSGLRKYRKRKCRIMLMTQNLADLEILFGNSTTRAIMSNLKFKVLLGGLGETESQKYFADLIGYKDTVKHSTSSNSHDTTQTQSESREYKIEPAELDRQGKDIAILIHPEGEGYLKLKKNYYFK